MASINRSHRGEASLWKLWATGILALLAFIWWNTYTAAGARAALEQQQTIEMALESRRVCEKWGMPPGTKRHDICVADIEAVRDHHTKRVMEDFGFLGNL
ncbi:MAG TPA: hypothetical protein VI137_13605 [Pseudolabrys sp.]|jgi:hypothetical protein